MPLSATDKLYRVPIRFVKLKTNERLTIKSQVFEGRNPKEVSQTTAAFDKQHSSAEIGRARAMEGTVNKAATALA